MFSSTAGSICCNLLITMPQQQSQLRVTLLLKNKLQTHSQALFLHSNSAELVLESYHPLSPYPLLISFITCIASSLLTCRRLKSLSTTKTVDLQNSYNWSYPALVKILLQIPGSGSAPKLNGLLPVRHPSPQKIYEQLLTTSFIIKIYQISPVPQW